MKAAVDKGHEDCIATNYSVYLLYYYTSTNTDT